MVHSSFLRRSFARVLCGNGGTGSRAGRHLRPKDTTPYATGTTCDFGVLVSDRTNNDTGEWRVVSKNVHLSWIINTLLVLLVGSLLFSTFLRGPTRPSSTPSSVQNLHTLSTVASPLFLWCENRLFTLFQSSILHGSYLHRLRKNKLFWFQYSSYRVGMIIYNMSNNSVTSFWDIWLKYLSYYYTHLFLFHVCK